jgi:hypothetical protein
LILEIHWSLLGRPPPVNTRGGFVRLGAANRIKKAFDWRVDGSRLEKRHWISLLNWLKCQINSSILHYLMAHRPTRVVQASVELIFNLDSPALNSW